MCVLGWLQILCNERSVLSRPNLFTCVSNVMLLVLACVFNVVLFVVSACVSDVLCVINVLLLLFVLVCVPNGVLLLPLLFCKTCVFSRVSIL